MLVQNSYIRFLQEPNDPEYHYLQKGIAVTCYQFIQRLKVKLPHFWYKLTCCYWPLQPSPYRLNASLSCKTTSTTSDMIACVYDNLYKVLRKKLSNCIRWALKTTLANWIHMYFLHSQEWLMTLNDDIRMTVAAKSLSKLSYCTCNKKAIIYLGIILAAFSVCFMFNFAWCSAGRLIVNIISLML